MIINLRSIWKVGIDIRTEKYMPSGISEVLACVLGTEYYLPPSVSWFAASNLLPLSSPSPLSLVLPLYSPHPLPATGDSAALVYYPAGGFDPFIIGAQSICDIRSASGLIPAERPPAGRQIAASLAPF